LNIPLTKRWTLQVIWWDDIWWGEVGAETLAERGYWPNKDKWLKAGRPLFYFIGVLWLEARWFDRSWPYRHGKS
jgi:hypothetical protein